MSSRHTNLTEEPHFDILVVSFAYIPSLWRCEQAELMLYFFQVGAGGGPSENDLSCYCECASLSRAQPRADSFSAVCKPKWNQWCEGFSVLDCGSGAGAVEHLLQTKPEIFHDFADGEAGPNLHNIWRWIKGFLITHAHFGKPVPLSDTSIPRLISKGRSHCCGSFGVS